VQVVDALVEVSEGAQCTEGDICMTGKSPPTGISQVCEAPARLATVERMTPSSFNSRQAEGALNPLENSSTFNSFHSRL